MLPELKPHMIRQMLGRDDARILEIGASDGTDTVAFLEAFPKGRIDCFECDPRAIRLWRQNIPGDHPRARLCEFALGEKTGKATFHQSGGRPPGARWEGLESWYHSGSLLIPDQHTDYEPWLTFPTTIEVEVVALDTWIKATKMAFDFLWMDVQGAEAAVLRGAQRVVPHIRYVYCKCHSRPYYKGQATLQEIKKLLPGFVFHSEHGGENYCFRNEAMK